MEKNVILYGDINDFSINELFDSFRNKLPECLLKRIFYYKNCQNRSLSIMGYYLLIKGLIYQGKDETCLYGVKINQYGKSYLPNESIYFNISHSENMAICILSNCTDVGIDIELKKEINYKELKIYTSDETKLLKQPLFGLEDFYKIWTRKESIIKCIGVGLQIDLRSLDVTKNIICFKKMNYYISSFTLLEKYACSYATTLQIMDTLQLFRIKD